jgi:RNA polymerase sigma-70 factor, ECF subfamily
MLALSHARADEFRPAATEESADEAALVRAAMNANPRAFDAIVRLHTSRVFNFLHQFTRHRQDAEDLTQQTFIKAFHALPRFDPTRPLINWLLTIARRTALNHFRAARRWEEMPAQVACGNASPARSAEEHDQAENLWARARRALSQREFEVMWLRFGEELSTEETARIAGLTESNVKVIVHRARQQLLKGVIAS